MSPAREIRLLLAANVKFELQIGEDGWCHLSISREGQRVLLGAESFAVIVERLLTHLRPPEGATAFAPGDTPWTCALSMYEEHGSLFVRPTEDGLELRVQDAQGQTAMRFTLPRAAALAWTATLARWRDA